MTTCQIPSVALKLLVPQCTVNGRHCLPILPLLELAHQSHHGNTLVCPQRPCLMSNLNCFIFGKEPPEYHVFTVNVARACNVSALKTLIKAQGPHLDYTSAHQLHLFKPSNGIVLDKYLEEALGENPFGDSHFQKLLPMK